MKKLLALLLVALPCMGQNPLLQTGQGSAQVNVYMDGALGTNGSQLTIGGLNVHGSGCTGAYVTGGSELTTSTAVAPVAPGAFSVGSIWEPGNNSALDITYTPTTTNTYILDCGATGPPYPVNASFGAYYTTAMNGSNSGTANSILIGISGAGGDYVFTHWDGNACGATSSNAAIHMNSSDSGPICFTPGHTYWVTGLLCTTCSYNLDTVIPQTGYSASSGTVTISTTNTSLNYTSPNVASVVQFRNFTGALAALNGCSYVLTSFTSGTSFTFASGSPLGTGSCSAIANGSGTDSSGTIYQLFHYLMMFDPQTTPPYQLVGATRYPVGASLVKYYGAIAAGRDGADSSVGSGATHWGYIVGDTANASFPLIPTNINANAPTYTYGTGSYNANVTETITDLVPTTNQDTSSNGILYCTDTNNTCTPSTVLTTSPGTFPQGAVAYGTVTISATGTYLRAKAVSTGWTPSAITSALYTITAPVPTFSPTSPYTGVATTVTITSAGSTINYCTSPTSISTCGSTTSSSSPVSLSFTSSEYICAYTSHTNWTSSAYACWQGTLTAAVGYDAAYSSVNHYGSSISWSHTRGTGQSNYAVYVKLFGQNSSTVTCTYDSVSMTQVATNSYSGVDYIWTFILVNPPSGTKTVACSSSTTMNMWGTSTTWYGVNQSTPTRTPVTTTGSTSTASITVSNAQNGDAVEDAISAYSNLPASGGSQVVTFTGNVGAGYWNGIGAYVLATGSTTLNWTNTGYTWTDISVAIRP